MRNPSGNELSRLMFAALLLIGVRVKGQALAPEATLAWQPVDTRVRASLRGLSVVDTRVVWVSGSGGVCLRSVDAGSTWTRLRVPGADSLDFRDVQAFDAHTAFLMSAGPGARSRIYKTEDGGATWTLQLQLEHEDGFLNGLAFWDRARGIAVSDPVEGRLLLFVTTNAGRTWQRVPPERLPPAREDEYGFAASGTGVAVYASGFVWVATGGSVARVFRSSDAGRTWAVVETPFLSGTPSSGIFSLAFRDLRHGVAVGGDYRQPEQAHASVARTTDGGRTWSLIADEHFLPYRSCVAYVPGTGATLVAVGPTGSDVSFDDGRTWRRFSDSDFHVVAFGGTPSSGWAAGGDGRVARLELRLGETR